MHKGKLYPTNPLLRPLCGNFLWPAWFPLEAYEGYVTVLQSPDWSEPIGNLGPTWSLNNYTPGDESVIYRTDVLTLDGHDVWADYHWELDATRTILSGDLDIFVDGVQQLRNPPVGFPPGVKALAGYTDSFEFNPPANPFKVVRWSVGIHALPY